MLEILAPAGNLECAKAAIDNGADAIYLGLSAFSARQGAENFDKEGFRAILQYAHFCGAKVYVAMNTIVKDSELEDFVSNLLFAWSEGADAIILQDIFLGKWIHTQYPDIVLHLSTQAGVCNLYGAKLAKEYGFSRVILARETPLKEIAEIANFMETEAFVQGALCTAFSGQCYFSSFVGGNSGNRGRCKQPCRKLYAYDRKGNTEKSYALSLSDLCVGEEIEKLAAAGVVSFKIEGRMRRKEYVAAATRYYRRLLDCGESTTALSALKRTYNRGNYTRGLAFGQDKRLLSTAIQGHIGEKVGVVKVINNKFLVESSFKPQTGDAFKILRGGVEIGGATYLKTEGKCFVLNSKIRLKNGDGVFVTTDTAVNARVLQAKRQGTLILRLSFREGELPLVSCGEFSLYGKNPLQRAQNRPLTAEELKANFLKTDGLPVEISFDEVEVQGDIFLPKGELNAFRREFYSQIASQITKNGHCEYAQSPISKVTFTGKNQKTAVIAGDFTGVRTDIAIYKPTDFNAPLPVSFVAGTFEKYLYYPAYLTGKDLLAIERLCQDGKLEGIYAENYGGIAFAKERGLKVFAGVGFHLLNGVSVQQLLQEPITYYTLSKEGNGEELSALASESAFALASGDIKLMDLCYCPFGKTCAQCDKRERYNLTDEGGRVFPVRRYLAADGSCRFEVYNCANLIGLGGRGAGRLLDLTVQEQVAAAADSQADEGKQKALYAQYTSGHFKRGVL